MLSSQQRFLKCINREVPDRLPVTTHHLMDSFLKNYAGGMDGQQFFDRFGFDEHGFAMQHYATMVMANINNIFIACANRVGLERDTTFFGKSLIVSPSGWPIGGLASESGEDILLAKINLMEARIGKSKNEFNDIIRDRRHDVYDEMLGYTGYRYPY